MTDRPQSTRLIGLEEVIEKTHYSKSKIYRLMAKGRFPQQADKPGDTTSALWHEDKIDAYVESLRVEPRPKKPEVKLAAPASSVILSRPTIVPQKVKLPKSQSKPRSASDFPELIPSGIVYQGVELYLSPQTGTLFQEVGRISREMARALFCSNGQPPIKEAELSS